MTAAFLQAVADGDGVTISTGQAVGALVFLITTIGSLLAIIRALYIDQIKQLETRIARLEEDGERGLTALEQAVDLLSRQQHVTEEVVKPPVRRGRAGD